MSNKSKLLSKDTLSRFFTEIKTHWKTPAEGKYVPYREYKDVVLVVGSNYAGSKVLEYIGFWSSCQRQTMHSSFFPSAPVIISFLTCRIVSTMSFPGSRL